MIVYTRITMGAQSGGSSDWYSRMSPGLHCRALQMASRVENRIAFAFPCFRMDRLAIVMPTFSDSSVEMVLAGNAVFAAHFAERLVRYPLDCSMPELLLGDRVEALAASADAVFAATDSAIWRIPL